MAEKKKAKKSKKEKSKKPKEKKEEAEKPEPKKDVLGDMKAKKKSFGAEDKEKKNVLERLVGFLAWLTGVIVSLAVGFGMTSGTLTVPKIQPVVPFFGWVVIVTTLLSVVLAIIHKVKK